MNLSSLRIISVSLIKTSLSGHCGCLLLLNTCSHLCISSDPSIGGFEFYMRLIHDRNFHLFYYVLHPGQEALSYWAIVTRVNKYLQMDKVLFRRRMLLKLEIKTGEQQGLNGYWHEGAINVGEIIRIWRTAKGICYTAFTDKDVWTYVTNVRI